MSRARIVRSKGVVSRFAEAMGRLPSPGDYVRVERGIPRSLVMHCPDGCGELLTINIDPRAGRAWRTFEKSGRLTLYPSVWRETGCRAHFIIWNDRLIWCDNRFEAPPPIDDALTSTVLRALPPGAERPRHFEEIAQELGAIPWDVWWACQALARAGKAIATDEGRRFRASTGAGPDAPSGIGRT